MDRMYKHTLYRRSADILHNEKGASIVFVSIIAIIVVTGVVILRVTSSSLWASANKQCYLDRAYVMATSLGSSIDVFINDKTINLESFDGTAPYLLFSETVGNDKVTATVTKSGDGYLIEVKADIPNSVYVYRAYYYKSDTSNSYLRQLL